MPEVFQSMDGLMAGGQHTFVHTVAAEPTVNVKVEKNSRGFNYEITVVGAPSVERAMSLIRDAELKLRTEYGEKAV